MAQDQANALGRFNVIARRNEPPAPVEPPEPEPTPPTCCNPGHACRHKGCRQLTAHSNWYCVDHGGGHACGDLLPGGLRCPTPVHAAGVKCGLHRTMAAMVNATPRPGGFIRLSGLRDDGGLEDIQARPVDAYELVCSGSAVLAVPTL